jgi:ubiquinone/menaquinone biosynthesis C-methylase UbiE
MAADREEGPKTDYEREMRWWDAKVGSEEQDLADEAVNRGLRWREIDRHLDGVTTILEVGAGTGAFSVPLAQRGFAVTHLDLSPRMLELARQKANGLDGIDFVQGNAVDLSQFDDDSFDLVLNMDGAVSFCGVEAEKAVAESCRVTRSRLIVTVTNRSCMVPVWVDASLKVAERILPAVRAMLDRGEWRQDQFAENPLLS